MAEKNFILHSNSIPLPSPMMAGSSDPIDARYIVKTFNNLTAGAATWNTSGNYALVHIGMQVYVADEKTLYMYVGPEDAQNGVLLSETQKRENWRKVSTTNDKLENITVNGVQGSVSNNISTVTLNSDKFILGDVFDNTTLVDGSDLTVKKTDNLAVATKKMDKAIKDSGKVVKELKTKVDSFGNEIVSSIESPNNSIECAIKPGTGSGKVYTVSTDGGKIALGDTFDTTVLTDTTIKKTDSVTVATKKIEKIILDNEKVTSGALNDLNTRIKATNRKVVSSILSPNNTITVNRFANPDGTARYELEVVKEEDKNNFVEEVDDTHNVSLKSEIVSERNQITGNIDLFDCGEY